ncbi:MAG: glycosyltransferase family 1 protein [Anaerolineales bacterium]
MSVKIAINGRFQQRRITGVDRHAHEISKRLTAEKYFITPNHSLGQIIGHFWEQFILPAKIQRSDVLWSPANAGPWSVSNQVVTLHDASVFDHPEWFNPTFAAWTRLSWKMLAKRAKAIITVSNFSQERLSFHLSIPREKIHVIYNGVGEPFEPQSQIAIELIKEKYELNKPYFLFVGTDEPRKNVAGLVQAWENLNLKSHSLFIAGEEGKVFANQKVREARSLQTYVSDEELPALYSGATAFIVPSFYEGFGLTVLEAMACGTPVIISDIPVFRELFEETALFINPFEPKEIANAMLKIIEDKSLAMKLRERGLIHAAKFSWDESARKTQDVII